MPLQTTDLTPLIGTRVDADKDMLLSGDKARELRALLEDRGVLIFKQIGMSDEEQRTFAHTIGTPTDQGERGLHKISMDEKVTATAKYLKGTILWHFDGWNDATPARGTVLTGRVLSQTGGQTEFSNAYAAYDQLSEETKARIATLKVAHTMEEPSAAYMKRSHRKWRVTGPISTSTAIRSSGRTSQAASRCYWVPVLTGSRAWTGRKAMPCSPNSRPGPASRASSIATSGMSAT